MDGITLLFVLWILGAIGYGCYKCWLLANHPDLYAQLERQKHEREMQKRQEKMQKRKSLLMGIGSGLVRACFGHHHRH